MMQVRPYIACILGGDRRQRFLVWVIPQKVKCLSHIVEGIQSDAIFEIVYIVETRLSWKGSVSHIFDPLQPLHEFQQCFQRSSLWVGMHSAARDDSWRITPHI